MIHIYTINLRDGIYFHKDGKIIIFETVNEANEFLNEFIRYSVNRLSHKGRMEEAMSAPIRIMSESVVMPVNFDINAVPCGVVFARELRKK